MLRIMLYFTYLLCMSLGWAEVTVKNDARLSRLDVELCLDF